MLPFLNMRLYRGNNLNLSKHIEKLKNNQLTIENVLEEEDIIQDLKLNSNSQFLSILSNEAIRKLIDYATRMPSSDDQKIGHKYPFNATEILCADNSSIQERIMNELQYKESEFYEDLKEGKDDKENKGDEKVEKKEEKEGEENKNEEKNTGEKKEEKKEAGEQKPQINFVSAINNSINALNNAKNEEEKNKENENEKNETTEKPKEETQKDEEPKLEEKKEETKPEEPKQEEAKKEEPKPEEQKPEEQKPEEQKPEEQKPEEQKPEEAKKEEKPEEVKKQETTEDSKQEEKKEEPKPEEPKQEKKEEESKPEESKTETAQTDKLDKKPEEGKEETKPEEAKEETKPEEVKEETKPKEEQDQTKKDEVKPEEIKLEENETEEEAKKENENEDEDDDEEKGQHKHFPKEDEEDDNQKENEENEDSEKEDDVKTVTIYDNIDYLFDFLKQSKETVTNHVLVGYFYKILNHLISSQSSKIVQYIFDYPKKSKFDVLDSIVVNLNRKSMGSIVNKLLLFSDEGIDLNDKKMLLVQRMLEELEKCTEKDKYECICEVLASTLTNKTFYISLMSNQKLVELLFSLLEKSVDNPKKLISIINLLIKVNENVLKNFSSTCTKNLTPENPLDFMSLFNYDNSYPLDEKQINKEEMDEINKNVLLSLFNTLKKTEFKFLEDLGVYNQDNEEFLTTYQQKQKKIGMKKLAQIEFLRTILDIFVNSYYNKFHETEIEELIKIIKDKNIFYNCHKLFFDFPFSNIYQAYYNQIIEIVMNQNAPECLVEYFFKYSDEKGEKNLVTDLMEHFFNNMKLTFNSSNKSFNPCFSYEITLLNKINQTDNEHLKNLFNEDNNLKVFDEVLGEEINHIFNQKLLLTDTLGANLGTEEEKPLPTFGKANFLEILEEDTNIYNIYKEGGNYKTKLEEKIEREKAEKEKAEKEKADQEIVGEEEENKDEHIHQDDDEENEEGVEEIGVDREGDEEGEKKNEAEENEKEDDEEKEKEKEKEEKEEKEKEDEENNDDKRSTSTEESAEEKKYNEVNFWAAPITPNDDIMSAILNDIE